MTLPIEQAFVYCPRCATRRAKPAGVPFRCDACDFTLFFGPVAAVGALVVNDDAELLLVRRARDPGKGKWGLPGGFVDRGETIEQALNREVIEETALRLVSMELLVTFPNQYNYRGVVSPVIDLFYVCQAEDPSVVELEAAELDDYSWSNPETSHLETPYLDQMAFESNRKAIECWIRRRNDDCQ